MENGYTRFIISIILVGLVAIGIGMFALNTANTPEEAGTQEETPTANEVMDTPLPDLTLTPRTITLPDGTERTFRLASGFSIHVAAEELGKARFMAMSPDGRVFVPDLVDYRLSHEGKLYVLGDFNSATQQFESKHEYLTGLRGPNSVAFYTDADGQTWLYLALTAHVVRYQYEPGDTEPRGDGEVIAAFPNKQVQGEESVVWHITRTIKFHNGRLYASVGSGCNSCEQPEGQLRGMIYSMQPDGSDVQVYATGLRNAVGFDWADDSLYATENGADHLGPNAPDGLLYKLTQGEHYGWPHCFEVNGEVRVDTSTEWTRSYACDAVPEAFATFEPHAAPLGITYFANGVAALRDTFLVALHGSFEASRGAGYRIERIDADGEKQTFMDGFLGEDYTRYGRPVAFLPYQNGFLFTDDHTGRIYYVSETN